MYTEQHNLQIKVPQSRAAVPSLHDRCPRAVFTLAVVVVVG